MKKVNPTIEYKQKQMNLYLIDNKNYLLEKNYSNNLNNDYTSTMK